MLSFGLVAFVLVTVIVVLWILYVVYFAERPAAKVTEMAPSLKEQEELPTEPEPKTDSPKCSFGFGYLKEHAKNLPYPDECLSCPSVLECKECPEETQTKQIAVGQPEKKGDEVEVELRELEKKVISG